MASPQVDIGQLSESQQLALEQYTAVTNQEPDAAIPLLQRSQWNLQVCCPAANLILTSVNAMRRLRLQSTLMVNRPIQLQKLWLAKMLYRRVTHGRRICKRVFYGVIHHLTIRRDHRTDQMLLLASCLSPKTKLSKDHHSSSHSYSRLSISSTRYSHLH
jgi:hypothetical protein